MALPSTISSRGPRGRRFQFWRWTSLWLSLGFTVLVPLAHLVANAAQSGGVTASPWTGWARSVAGGARIPVSGAPWSVGLWGLEFLDPLAVLGLVAVGAAPWSLWTTALPTFVLVLLLGRYFCGWVCPYALLLGASNALRERLRALGLPILDLRISPRVAYAVLLGLLLATLLSGQQIASLLYPPAVIGRALGKWVLFGSAGVGGVFILAIFVFDSTISKAGYCRSFCPGGAVFRLLSWRSPIRVERTAAACTDCQRCDEVCNFALSPMTDRVDASCERCGKCVASCPTGALDLVLIGQRPQGGAS